MTSRKNIVIIHGYNSYPLRATIRDLMYCYDKYVDNANCFYLNLNHKFGIPWYISFVQWDIIIFHTTYLSGRWMGSEFFDQHVLRLAKYFKSSKAIKIVLPQDEWIHCNSMVKFINELNIDHVFSVSPPSEWEIIYKGVDLSKVKFHEVLTGYIETDIVAKVNELGRKNNFEKSIDIGYRAFSSPPWLGKFGFLKTKVADVFLEKAPAAGFKIDISTKQEDTILGDKWYEFMLKCKYFIGVEGGSTVIDRDGEIWKKGMKFISDNPRANFEQIEENVFKGMDGNLKLKAISPRHLEACITRTAQVLIEGNYNGILKAGVHYIELKKDFSNLTEVLNAMKNEDLRKEIEQRAYLDIVQSEKYTYKNFANYIVQTSLQGSDNKGSASVLSNYFLKLNRNEENKRWETIRKEATGEKDMYQRMHGYFKYTFFPKVKGKLKKVL